MAYSWYFRGEEFHGAQVTNFLNLMVAYQQTHKNLYE